MPPHAPSAYPVARTFNLPPLSPIHGALTPRTPPPGRLKLHPAECPPNSNPVGVAVGYSPPSLPSGLPLITQALSPQGLHPSSQLPTAKSGLGDRAPLRLGQCWLHMRSCLKTQTGRLPVLLSRLTITTWVRFCPSRGVGLA